MAEQKYFNPQTIKKFASQPYKATGNRRGYGFDKPQLPQHKYGPCSEKASRESFGHTGFTGTLVWVDPKYDLVFIFLSNRIHPDAANKLLISNDVRTQLQNAVYDIVLGAGPV
ncbi:MAG: beta-lactamase family protein [Bacteroidales bacterium]|nr:beta-lactamase family protein [Bacteroidales bacterium]